MKYLYALWLIVAISPPVFAQDTANHTISFGYIHVIEGKLRSYQLRFDRHLIKSLLSAEKAELRALQRLQKIDPAKAASLTQSCKTQYTEWRSRVTPAKYIPGGPTEFYNQYLDTLQGIFRYLSSNKKIVEPLQKALGNIGILQTSLNSSDRILEELRQRQLSLVTELGNYKSIASALTKYNKQVHYYTQEAKAIKESLQNPEKAERKTLEILRKTNGFNRFMEKHSMLTGLFGLNDNVDPTQALEGLQTRSQVEQVLQSRIGSDPSARQTVMGQLNQAREQFSLLKKKFPNLDKTSEIPGFKPNYMKTKPFLQRLKWGGNVEFKRGSNWYPSYADLGAQIGYQLHEKKIIGIGLSYKAGFGSIDHLRYSNEGIGLRSFLEWKLKNVWYLNGGAEMNHYLSFSTIQELQNWNRWQTSALIGVSRKYKVNAKLNSSIQVLYDLLANRQMPMTNPFLIRFNYSKN